MGGHVPRGEQWLLYCSGAWSSSITLAHLLLNGKNPPGHRWGAFRAVDADIRDLSTPLPQRKVRTQLWRYEISYRLLIRRQRSLVIRYVGALCCNEFSRFEVVLSRHKSQFMPHHSLLPQDLHRDWKIWIVFVSVRNGLRVWGRGGLGRSRTNWRDNAAHLSIFWAA